MSEAPMQWADAGTNGSRRFNRNWPLTIKVAEVAGGRIYRFEDEVDEASGMGGTVTVVRPSYVFVPEVRNV